MTRKFESHLTIDIKYAAKVEAFALNVAEYPNPLGIQLKFSKIDGDAQMGAKPFCYLTAYDTDGRALAAKMANIELILDAQYSIPVLRTKVEEIVYDTKTGHDVLTVPTVVQAIEEKHGPYD